MSAFGLKIIAIITMIIDHLGYAIFGEFSFFNYIFTAINPNINPIIVPMVLAFPS